MSDLNPAVLAALAVDAYDIGTELVQGLPPGFVRLTVPGGGGVELRGAAYYNAGTGELVIAYCGSESLRSMFTNFSFVESTSGESALNQALDFVDAARDVLADAGVDVADGAIHLTGHGVGGGFASLVSVARGLQATTFNGTRIGALVEALETRFGMLDDDYAGRIVNYVLEGEEIATMPRGAEYIGGVDDVAATELTFLGQLSTALGSPASGGTLMDSIYDWLAADNADRQRAQRTLMALELKFGAVATGDGIDADRERMLDEQLNKLIQTSYADVLRSHTFDRLMVDGSDAGQTQDATAYGESNDLIIGAKGADRLLGGDGQDLLFGGDGNDVLNGGAGRDLLYGGAGADLYALGIDAAADAVRDTQGANRITINGRGVGGAFFEDADGLWRSADGRTSLALASGSTALAQDGVTVDIEEFSDGMFGLHRFARAATPTADAVEGDVDALDDYLVGTAAAETVSGGLGQDRVFGDAGADRIHGGADSDALNGGDGDDWIYGDAEVALAAVATQASGVSSRGDWLSGNEGNDVLVGTALNDALSGGGGQDLLIGGGGDDVIWGDADYIQRDANWSVTVNVSKASTDYPLNDPASAGADVVYAGNGRDFVEAGRGHDVVYGGDGDDVLVGGAGADTLFGEQGADRAFGSDRRGSMDRSEDFIDGGTGDDELYASDGDNLLFGGDGNDFISSGAGNDYVDAGDGDDTVLAMMGADVVYGGAGNDIVQGMSTTALMLDGGTGDDWLSSDLGDDSLRGGEGRDTLIGNEGADFLDGGEGDDTYRFHLGDGVDEIRDADGSDTIEIVSDGDGAITRDGIRLVADSSEIWLAYGDQGDRVRLGVDPRRMIENVALRTSTAGGDTVERWALDSMHVSVEGSASSEALFAVTGFVSALSGGSGRDVLFGADRDDVLEGGGGDDLMKGGEGADRYVVGLAAGMDTIHDDGASGHDTIDFAANANGVTLGLSDGALFIDLGGGNGVRVAGFQANDALNTVAVEQFRFADRTMDATGLLDRGFDIAGSGRSTLTGTSVSDRFTAGTGDERLIGGRGNDTYTFSRGFGRDVVVDQDTTEGNYDRVVFSGDIQSSDVTLTASADRLMLRVNDTDDVLEVQWAPMAGARIESIEFADLTWTAPEIEALFQPANRDPKVVSPLVDQVAREDAAFRFTVPAGTFRDPDRGETLALAATLADGSPLPSWLTFDGTTFSGTPANGDVGRVTVRVTASDRNGAAAYDDFEIGVANTNDAPTLALALPDAEVAEDGAFTYAIPAGSFIDVDAGDTVRYLATLDGGGSLPAWLRFDEATGTFTGTPGNADVGTVSVVVMAIDGAGAMARDRVDFAVLNENDGPELVAPLADVSGREGHLLEIEIPAGAFRDVDANDLLTFSATLASGEALPPWLVYDAEAQVLRGDPTRADVGSYAVRLTATDSEGASVSDVFTVTIDAVPGLTLIGGSGDDLLVGDAGDDRLNGRQGKDTLIGGAGDDRLLFYRDAVWGDSVRRTNLGSPDASGTGETASLARRGRSFDVFRGGDGVDTLQGTGAADAVLLDDVTSPGGAEGARIQSVEAILAGGGDDVVDLTSASYSLGNVRVEGGSGSDVIWSSGGDDVLLGGAGADRIFGGAGNDFLGGGGGGDDLNGGLGDDVIQGDSGNDRLLDGAGSSVFDGRGGADEILEGAGNSFIAGGASGDRITLGGGADVIAFNRGDGRDVIRGPGAATLSLGGGIRFDQLALRKSGADLVVEVGAGERITLQDWYASPANESILNLQVIAEVMQGYSPSSSNPLLDDKVERFDFGVLADRFDAARAAQPNMSRWLVMNALLDAHLGGADDAALGGDLAYRYGTAGSLSGIGVAAAQQIAGDAAFGKATQTLLSPAALAEGAIKLA